jgi:hypothetical protein
MNKMKQQQQPNPSTVLSTLAVGRCNRELCNYVRSKGIDLRYGEEPFPPTGFHLASVCRAADKLAPRYDVGIGLACGGIPLSFILEKYGLPVSLVHAKRKGSGIFWDPMDELSEATLRDRRILVLEIDVLLGRTLRKTLAELERYKPKSIDLLLEKSHTFIPIPYYKNLLRKGGIWGTLPPFAQVFEETSRMLKKRFLGVEKVTLDRDTIVVQKEDGTKKFGNVLFVDLKPNVPKGFDKIMSVDDNFTFYIDTNTIRGPLDEMEGKILSTNRPSDEMVTNLKMHYLNSLVAKLMR